MPTSARRRANIPCLGGGEKRARSGKPSQSNAGLEKGLERRRSVRGVGGPDGKNQHGEARRFFAPLAGRWALLAVSGGPDSLALMRLAARWLVEGQAGGAASHVATVDHGLRPDRGQEAEAVAGWAEAVGLPHSILTWQGAKPRSRIQERARTVRYALLGAHARELGADYLLTAHHADDQAETILFRLLRGSGLAGLAGMSSEIMLGNIRLYRLC